MVKPLFLSWCMSQGKIIPIKITIQVILDEIIANPNKIFILDGFPRNLENVVGFFKFRQTNELLKNIKISGCLNFMCPEQVSIDRLLAHGESVRNRSDDNIQNLRKRFLSFTQETSLVFDRFLQPERESELVRIIEIDSTPSVETVYQQAKLAFEKLIEPGYQELSK